MIRGRIWGHGCDFPKDLTPSVRLRIQTPLHNPSSVARGYGEQAGAELSKDQERWNPEQSVGDEFSKAADGLTEPPQRNRWD